MTAYEIYLLLGTLVGVLAALSLASVLLDQGSVRIFAFFMAVSLGLLYMAKQNSEAGVNFNDVPPAIAKVLKPFLPDDG